MPRRIAQRSSSWLSSKPFMTLFIGLRVRGRSICRIATVPTHRQTMPAISTRGASVSLFR